MLFPITYACLILKRDRDHVKAPVQIKGIIAQNGNKKYYNEMGSAMLIIRGGTSKLVMLCGHSYPTLLIYRVLDTAAHHEKAMNNSNIQAQPR